MKNRLTISAIVFALIFPLGVSAVSAQGFSSILNKLETLEKKMSNLETTQKKDISSMQKQLAKVRNESSASGEVEIALDIAKVNSSFVGIKSRVDKLSEDVEHIKSDAGHNGDIEEFRELAINVQAMLEELREDIKSVSEAAPAAYQEPFPEQLNEASALEAIAESKLEVSTDGAVVNRYVWRGILLTKGPVFQPSLTLGGGNFSFNVWSNMDLDDVNANKMQVNELDFTLDYSFSLKSYGISVGIIPYTFPNTDFNSTTEVYLGLGADVVLSPSVTIYKDIDESDGTYISFGFGHSLPVERLSSGLDLSAAIGWGSGKNNEFYYSVAKNSATDIYFGASMSFQVGEFLSLTPSLGYAGLLQGEIRNSFEDKDHVLAGITVSSSF